MKLRKLGLILALFAALAVALTACGGSEQRKARHMQLGQTLYEQGDYDKARAEFASVLQIDATDVPARFMLGRSLEASGQPRAAAREYLAVLQSDAGHVPARERLARLFLAARAIDQAEAMVKPLLASEPDNVVGLTVMAWVNAVRGQTAAAVDLAERAIEIEPGDGDAAELLAALYVARGEAGRAIELLERVRDLNPQDADLGVVLAQAYMQDDRPDAAESLLRELVAGQPEALRPKLLLVELLRQREGPEVAEQTLQGFIAASPGESGLRFALAALYVATEQSGKARTVYREIIAEDEDAPAAQRARVDLARLLLVEGDRDAGRALVEAVLERDPDNTNALALRGRLALIEGDAAAAVADLDRVAQAQPQSVETLKLLARAHGLNGQPELARRRLAKAVELAPDDLSVRFDYGRLLAEDEQWDGALTQFDAILERDPQDMRALEAKVRVQIAQRSFEPALETAKAIARSAPDKALGDYYLGLVRLSLGDFEAGIERLQAALEKEPGAVEPLTALVRAYLEREQPAEAEQLLEDTLSRIPEHTVARNLLGEVHLAQQRYEDAAAAFAEVTRERPEWWLPYRNLALAQLARGDQEAAITAYRAGVANASVTEGLVVDLALLLERSGEPELAIAQYERYLADHPGSQTPANNLAMLLVEQRRDPQSHARARELVAGLQTQDNPAFLDTLGWVRLKTGDTEGAIEALEQAVALRSDAPEMRYHLARAYLEAGDEQKGRDQLEQALSGKPTGAWTEKARELLTQLGDGR
jgi:tetratricopeptide (TPR) repeat protein